MPIDLNLLRAEKGGNPELVRQSELKRQRDGRVVDEVISADNDWRQKIFEMEQMKKELNSVNKEIGRRKKVNASDGCSDLVAQSGLVKSALPVKEAETQEAERLRDKLLHKIGNLVDASVIASSDESQNEVLRSWGKPVKRSAAAGVPGTAALMHHHELMARLGLVEFSKGVELAGHRGYFLKGAGVMLNMALLSYGLAFLRRRGYTEIQPPFMIRKEVMSETAELADFEETLYRIPVAANKDDRDDLFLIATSEQPISALHRNQYIEEKTLPYKYAGVSTCFRKEAGSHGKDTWGLFRIHQFEKVEQFVLTTPEESTGAHAEMISIAEEFYQSLGIPYRVVSIVAGALNDAASKKLDLEGWFPGYETYRELVSCSNCLDYQSRALNVRLGHPKQGEREKRYVHMLNATLVASQRTMCSIVENYQTAEGVKVPPALIPYMDGLEFLHFNKEKPTEAGNQKS